MRLGKAERAAKRAEVEARQLAALRAVSDDNHIVLTSDSTVRPRNLDRYAGCVPAHLGMSKAPEPVELVRAKSARTIENDRKRQLPGADRKLGKNVCRFNPPQPLKSRVGGRGDAPLRDTTSPHGGKADLLHRATVNAPGGTPGYVPDYGPTVNWRNESVNYSRAARKELPRHQQTYRSGTENADLRALKGL